MKKLVFLFCVSLCMATVSFAQSSKDSSALSQYVGKYKFPEGSVVAEVIVKLENGALTMESSAGVSALEKKEDDLYVIVQFQGTAKFNRDTNKKITGVSINAMGYVLEGTRAESTTALINQTKTFYLHHKPFERAQVR